MLIFRTYLTCNALKYIPKVTMCLIIGQKTILLGKVYYHGDQGLTISSEFCLYIRNLWISGYKWFDPPCDITTYILPSFRWVTRFTNTALSQITKTIYPFVFLDYQYLKSFR